MTKYNDNVFQRIITPLIKNSDFSKTKEITHHGITRYEHSMRVAYFSYKVTKLLTTNGVKRTPHMFATLLAYKKSGQSQANADYNFSILGDRERSFASASARLRLVGKAR